MEWQKNGAEEKNDKEEKKETQGMGGEDRRG